MQYAMDLPLTKLYTLPSAAATGMASYQGDHITCNASFCNSVSAHLEERGRVRTGNISLVSGMPEIEDSNDSSSRSFDRSGSVYLPYSTSTVHAVSAFETCDKTRIWTLATPNSDTQTRECVKCGSVCAMTWRTDKVGNYLCQTCYNFHKLRDLDACDGLDAATYMTNRNCRDPQCDVSNSLNGQHRKIEAIPLPIYQSLAMRRRRPAQRNGMMCTNCQTSQTSLWRRTVEGDVVCNACGLYRKMHGRSRPIALRKDSVQTRKRRSKARRLQNLNSPEQTPPVSVTFDEPGVCISTTTPLAYSGSFESTYSQLWPSKMPSLTNSRQNTISSMLSPATSMPEQTQPTQDHNLDAFDNSNLHQDNQSGYWFTDGRFQMEKFQ